MAVGDRTQLGGTAYDRLRILTNYRNIAMVGLSSNPYQPSAFAGIYLLANGYNIIPVNPSQAGKTILGQRVYGRVDEIDVPVDIVDVFRPAAEVTEIARQAVKHLDPVCAFRQRHLYLDGADLDGAGGADSGLFPRRLYRRSHGVGSRPRNDGWRCVRLPPGAAKLFRRDTALCSRHHRQCAPRQPLRRACDHVHAGDAALAASGLSVSPNVRYCGKPSIV
jgi:predicted CoA-binding protein